MIKVDIKGAEEFFSGSGPDYAAAAAAHRALSEGTGAGSNFTGWLELPLRIIDTELGKIISLGEKIRSESDALVVIGIGGSYLGAKAAIDLMRSPNYNSLPKDTPDIYFAGCGLSGRALDELVAMIGDRDFSVNVISKSGTTLEPSVAYRVFTELLEKKYGVEGAKKRIYVTTDAARGVLKETADADNLPTLVVPDDVGGRFSVLSAVGLLPMAAAGIDVEKILNTAVRELHDLNARSPENPAWRYAATRQHLYNQGKIIEILACYEPAFRFFAEWWKQLYGESEGKNGVGIFPASVEFTADLHSMGQYIQDGPRHLMETVVSFAAPSSDIAIPFKMGDSDGLNYLAGKSLDHVNRTATEAVKLAHISGGVPNIALEASAMDEQGFAELVCFFEVACGISGYMSGVNPFDQPGVEEYKKSMFRLLGKPGAK